MRRSEIQVQQVLWAVGEAHRRRSAPDGGDQSGEPDVAGSTTLARDGSADSTIERSGFPRVTLSSDRHGARACLNVVGCLDGSAAPAFSALVRTLVDEGARSIVVDLGAADVVDAAGLQALVGAFEHLAQYRGEMVLRSPRSRTLQALNRAGLSDVLPIC